MTNEEQMQVLKEAIKSNYKGSLAEILQPQQQPQGPEGVDMQQQMPETPVPPASPPQINPASTQPPVQDNQGHLVQSYQSAPPGLRNLPSGPAEGMLIQKMEKGGTKDPNPKEPSIENIKQPTGTDEEAVISERTFDAFKNLDVVKDSYEHIPYIKPYEMQDYVEYDGKLVDKKTLKDYEEIENPVIRKGVLSDIFDQRRLDREEYVGSNILNRYEMYKDAGNADYTYETGKEMSDAPIFKAMDKVLPALDKLTDAEVQEFTRLINTLSSPYIEAMSENEDFGQGDAFKILMGQDLSGIKKYRKKMGLTKGDILDLVQPGKNAGVATKALASSAKAVIRLKDFEDGGPRITDGPRAIPSKESNEGMTGMTKAKIAMENEFGNNPAISRMIKPTDKSYDFGDGRTGTHHMGSYGKSAIPNIQDVGGSLQYTGPRTDEAINFNREQDARYFAEKYKDVAPALRKRKSGGYKPKYPQKFQEGGNDQVTPLDLDYVTYGTADYSKAYKQGKVATSSYDDQGDITFHMQKFPEIEIVADRDAPLSKADQAEYNKFLLDASTGAEAMRKGEEVTDAQREAANYLTKANPVKANIYRGDDFSDMVSGLAGMAVTAPIGGAGFMGTTGTQVAKYGSGLISKYAPTVYKNVLRPTGKQLLSPMQRYGSKAAKDFVNLTSKAPIGQSLMQTAKSKTGNLLSGSYNTMKGVAVPQAYYTIGKQVGTEIKGEGNIDNRLAAGKKIVDVVPQLAKIKDTFKIGKDLYDQDYDSAALRTLALAGDKNPLLKYGTKFLNKFTETDVLASTPSVAKEGISSLKQAITPLVTKPVASGSEGLIAANRYGGYRKKLRKKKRK